MASITQTGPNSYRVLIRRKGQKSISKSFRTRADAEAYAKLDGPGAGSVTVRDAVEAYRELREGTRRAVSAGSNEDYMLRHLTRDLGKVRVMDLSPDRMRRWAKQRASDGAGPYTLDMEVSKLGTVLRYASLSLHTALPDAAAAARPLLEHVGLIGPAAERERRLHPGEEERILALAPPWLRDVIRLALATGMRRGEIARIAWCDLDRDRRCVWVRDRKHPRKKLGNDHLIPLLGEAFEIVASQPRVNEEPRIFPRSPESISDSFKLVADAAGCDNLHFHDLRHEATSRLFESGYSIEQVALVTGHSDWRNLKRYTQLRPESLHGMSQRTQPHQRSGPDDGPLSGSS